MKVRNPSHAGTFYADSATLLVEDINKCFTSDFGSRKIPKVTEGPREIKALVCPHAGYMYSGPVASHSYYALASDGRPEIFVILGPNHTGLGSPVAMMNEGIWRTPLGDVQIDSETADQIFKESKIIDVNDTAHLYEHSIEVQLPFLQYLYGPTFKFVPICMMLQDLQTSTMVGKGISKALANKNAVIIASTDFTHYEPQEQAKRKDRIAIDAILKLDEKSLQLAIQRRNITICGPGPVMATMVAAKKLGAKKAKLLSYNTSGDITKDLTSVVGYASIAIL